MPNTTANSSEITVNATLNLNTILGEAPVEVKEMVALSMALSACMAAQNEVTALQERRLLDLARMAGEVFESGVPGRAAIESVQGVEGQFGEAFAPLLSRLQSASEQYQGAAAAAQSALNNHQASSNRDLPATESNFDPGDYRLASLATVYEAVADALAVSAQNAVANQQALNALGSPVLASAVNLIVASSK